MASEFTPAWSTPRMTKAQMRKYLADAKAVREAAKKKLPSDEEIEQERVQEIKKTAEKFDDVF